MTDDFRWEMHAAYGAEAEPPVDEIVARGRRLRQKRRTAATAGAAIVALILGALALNQIHGSTVYTVHTAGSPPPVPTPALSPSLPPSSPSVTVIAPPSPRPSVVPSMTRPATPRAAPSRTAAGQSTTPATPTTVPPGTQRTIAVASALLRYGFDHLNGDISSSPGPDVRLYVEDQFFNFSSDLADATKPPSTPAGPIRVDLQAGIVRALAPMRVTFLTYAQIVSLLTCGGVTQVLQMGVIPPAGDPINVSLARSGFASFSERDYGLTQTGQTWTVTGPTSLGRSALGGC